MQARDSEDALICRWRRDRSPAPLFLGQVIWPLAPPTFCRNRRSELDRQDVVFAPYWCCYQSSSLTRPVLPALRVFHIPPAHTAGTRSDPPPRISSRDTPRKAEESFVRRAKTR